jgi:hypothetical protein
LLGQIDGIDEQEVETVLTDVRSCSSNCNISTFSPRSLF